MDPMRPADTNAASGKSGPNLMLVVLAAIIAFVVIFVLRNDNPTEIDFMLFDWDTTVRWSIFIALIIGIVLDRVFSIWWRRRGKRKNDND
ncbi:MAG TPA: hypothetical protein DCR14_11695 [Acidimicrobiaceae bacterium]|nr:hypothetical protein [Acidimicrobiaceae bacterium]